MRFRLISLANAKTSHQSFDDVNWLNRELSSSLVLSANLRGALCNLVRKAT